MKNYQILGSPFLYTCLLLSLAIGCDSEGGGDESCPENTVRSGTECLPMAGEMTGGIGPITAGDEAGTEAGTQAGNMAGTIAGSEAGQMAGDTPPPLSFPIYMDNLFAPSGFMGEGEVENITADFACPERDENLESICHHFSYTPGDLGWGGVWWQAPANNWGDEPGASIPAGATSISFRAWGANGGERLRFGSGYGGGKDEYAVELAEITLSTTPQVYTIDLAGVPYSDIAGGFFWVTDESDNNLDFYIDELIMESDEDAEINPCTVSCSTLTSIPDCSAPGYVDCHMECEEILNGDCATQASAYQACLADSGWQCVDGNLAGSTACNGEFEALQSCTGGPQALALPFYVEDHFIMSGYMGGGDVVAEPCETDESPEGVCTKLTWTPNGAEWVGFFFQYPENNWGEMPGLMIAEGATHVRYKAWGEQGNERMNFATGIPDADGFGVEQGYSNLSTEPTEGYMLIPEGITELTGAFAWYLENPSGADSVTVYLDDVQWRNDEPPSNGEAIQGCTQPNAENYNMLAEEDDGSCVFPFEFNVDMNCAGIEFTTVYITGPFCEWCDAGYPLSDEDGDGVWTATYSFQEGPFEFKYMVDNFAYQEDLIGAGECASVTDGVNYANREVQITEGGSANHIYGRCTACDEEPPPPPPRGDFDTITFDDPNISYTLIGFGGADDSGVAADPTDAGNQVGRVFKNGTAELWAGTTVATQANDAVGVLPIDAENTRMTIRVYSPHSGIQVRLKAEDSTDNTITVETEATVTVSDAWETLTFDFAQQATGTAVLNPEATYDKISIFFNFGVTGADAGERTYYFDDITFIGGTTVVEPPTPSDYAVSFSVDMNCAEAPESFSTVYITGPFCEWCNAGYPLSDEDGDGVWTGTYTFPEGPLEFIYMVDNFASAENLIDDVQAGDGACAPITDAANYANRQITVAENASSNDIYGRCSACEQAPPPRPEFGSITFDDPNISYTLIGFGGADDSGVAADPTDAGNQVGRVFKNGTAELWAGTTVATQANDAVGVLPIDAENTRMTIRVYSPHSGIQVRLKAEDSTDNTITVETEATVTVSDAWETLTFDFAQQATGTAVLNPEATYDKISIFFNFGVTGADAGERTYYFDDITFIGGTTVVEPPTPSDYAVSFSVDMNCAEAPESFSTVYITGPFCEWCNAGYPLSDEDGDGVWTGTYTFPEGPLEFIYMVDNFASAENLIDDVQAGDGACAPITDAANYANRQITVAETASSIDIYGRCSACEQAPPPRPEFGSITFDDPNISYTLIGFGGADDSGVAADPTDAGNQVGRVFKNGTAELWAGTTVTTQANDAVGVLPIDAENTRMTIRVYSPHSGIQVRLKAEDSTDNTVTVETEATVTVSDTWETLTFDFAQQATGTAVLNPEATYDKISIFFNFGVTGADAGERTYYFDDITFIGGTTVVEPPTPSDYAVSFSVDMNCAEAPESFSTVYITGPFCEWCADGYPLSDEDGDGIWTGTYTFPEGPLEFKYMVDNFASQENLIDDVQAGDGACAPITDGFGYANRQVAVAENASSNDVYGRCSACESGLGTNGLLEEADGWRLTWSDEFNGAANTPIDATKWTHDIGGGGWGNAQLEFNTDRVENSFQNGDGYLVIKAIREDYQGNQYTSARIKTQGLFSQQYGRFEARIKMPYGQGLWPAFWMLGSDFETVGWPNCGEIDIMEFRGQNLYESTGALHGPGYSGGNSLYSARASQSSLAAGFHTYAVEWSPTSIKWFVDGDMYMERTPASIPPNTTWAFDHEFFMILNVAVGGNFLGNPDASTVFPQEMQVDYVRVYEAVVP